MSSRSEGVNVTEPFWSMCATFVGCSCVDSHSFTIPSGSGGCIYSAFGDFPLLLPRRLSAVAWTEESEIRMEIKTGYLCDYPLEVLL